MAKVLIVDDHPAIRLAVKYLLEQAQHEICGEVDNGVDAIQEFRMKSPDIVVLDLGIHRLDGLEVIKRIKTINVSAIIIILSTHNSRHVMLRCYQAGANGFVSKLEDLQQLRAAIDECSKGGKFFQSYILEQDKSSSGIDIIALERLSDREMNVFLAICQGKSNKDIAENMLLSEKTISTYKTRLMKKLAVENMVELLELAKRTHII
ncbi:response regulator transcription factor [Aeromonas hydrophila]|uniref:response regulator transcription factor n=1 Tax=Aeromonas hydrophila TaxID=644 RepID=UPI001C5B60CE|nr:response regulator transcription factor [Aeromonas hydrophila]MBW3812452.1 response regulator transcription factor [Aeromonas hydrophila]